MINYVQKELIQTLLECGTACEMCATACLNESDVNAMASCILMDRDCADICYQAARLIQRGSPLALQYLLLCEEACRMCADECQKHTNMEHCEKCAKACVMCAESCHAHHQPITQK